MGRILSRRSSDSSLGRKDGKLRLSSHGTLQVSLQRNKRIHHPHAVEDDEPSKKRSIYENEYSSSEDEYVLISPLTGNITHGSDYWLIDSGASKHMTGIQGILCKTLRT